MKRSTLLVFCLVLLTVNAAAQLSTRTRTAAQDAYVLAGRTIRIAPPEGFTDTMHSFPRISGRLIASESPLNEVLAVHVTDELLPQLKNGEDPDLPLYTKVSVLKELKNVDVEAADFATLVAAVEKQSPSALQSAVRSNEKDTSSRLSKHWGEDVNLKFGETRILGHFDKQPQAISSMFVMNAEMFGRKVFILGSMSLVHVNKRVLFFYIFCIPTSGADEVMVADLTRNWTAQVIAANK